MQKSAWISKAELLRRRDLTSWHGKEAFLSFSKFDFLLQWLSVFHLLWLCCRDSCWYVQDYLRLAQASQLRLSQSELEVVHIQSFCILGILGNFEVAMISVLPGGVSQHGWAFRESSRFWWTSIGLLLSAALMSSQSGGFWIDFLIWRPSNSLSSFWLRQGAGKKLWMQQSCMCNVLLPCGSEAIYRPQGHWICCSAFWGLQSRSKRVAAFRVVLPVLCLQVLEVLMVNVCPFSNGWEMGTTRFTYCPWPGDCIDLCFDLFIQSFARDKSGQSIHKR